MKVFKPVREQLRWGSVWKAASPTPVLPELVRRAWSLLLNAIARLGAVCTSEGLDLQSSSPPVCWDFFSACLSFSCLHSVAFVPRRLHTRCSFFFSFSPLLHVTSQSLAFLGISHFCDLSGGATCTCGVVSMQVSTPHS